MESGGVNTYFSDLAVRTGECSASLSSDFTPSWSNLVLLV